ncbi:MAG: histidine phosphatase family protein [Bacteroidota bacterium]
MRLISLVLLIFAVSVSRAQTTVILVRHAEKVQDGSEDPGLTEEGSDRAQELVRVLAESEIDDVYTTPFKRTRKTVEPLATHFGLELKEYNPFDLPKIVEKIKSTDKRTMVFSGHSNTTPILINLLLGEEKYKQLNDKDYDNLYIVTLNEGKSSVIQVAFGTKSVF